MPFQVLRRYVPEADHFYVLLNFKIEEGLRGGPGNTA